ncbi:hypothetical protein FRC07_003781, partial [Ceratobasidium sp. 392]
MQPQGVKPRCIKDDALIDLKALATRLAEAADNGEDHLEALERDDNVPVPVDSIAQQGTS